MQGMQRKFLSLLEGIANINSTKAQKAPPKLSTQEPSIHSSPKHISEHETYADAQQTPTQTQHGTLIQATSNDQNAPPSPRSTLGRSRNKASKNPAFNPLMMPQMSNRSPWDPDDDEFDPNVYKDVRRHDSKLYMETASQHSLCLKASTSSIASANSTRQPVDRRMHQTDSTSTRHRLRYMASTISMSTVSSFNSVNTVIYRPLQRHREATSVFEDTHDLPNQSQAPISPKSPDRNFFIQRDQLHRAQTDMQLHNEENNRNQVEAIASELKDPSRMNLIGTDLHDNIIAELYTNMCTRLPAYEDARRMHVIDHARLEDTTDIRFLHVQPRLCDAVATVLFYTGGVHVLGGFIDAHRPEPYVWLYRTPASSEADGLAIRRRYGEITVGVFLDKGSYYAWAQYVKCVVDLTGKWMATFVASGPGVTEVDCGRVDWDSFRVAGGSDEDAGKGDARHLLWCERRLARSLLKMLWEEGTVCREGGVDDTIGAFDDESGEISEGRC